MLIQEKKSGPISLLVRSPKIWNEYEGIEFSSFLNNDTLWQNRFYQ